jgi:hypothetical protein
MRKDFPGPGAYSIDEKRVLPDPRTIVYKKPPVPMFLKAKVKMPEPGTYDPKPKSIARNIILYTRDNKNIFN